MRAKPPGTGAGGAAGVLRVAERPPFAQEVDFRAPASTSDPQLAATMRDLAVRILPVYQESDANRYLNNLSALQLVAGSIDSAWNTRQSLMDRRRAQEAGRPVRQAVVFDLYMRARELAAQGPVPFAEAYAKAYQQTVAPMSDLDAYTFNGWLARPVYPVPRCAAAPAGSVPVTAADQHRSRRRSGVGLPQLRCLPQFLHRGDRTDPRR